MHVRDAHVEGMGATTREGHVGGARVHVRDAYVEGMGAHARERHLGPQAGDGSLPEPNKIPTRACHSAITSASASSPLWVL